MAFLGDAGLRRARLEGGLTDDGCRWWWEQPSCRGSVTKAHRTKRDTKRIQEGDNLPSSQGRYCTRRQATAAAATTANGKENEDVNRRERESRCVRGSAKEGTADEMSMSTAAVSHQTHWSRNRRVQVGCPSRGWDRGRRTRREVCWGPVFSGRPRSWEGPAAPPSNLPCRCLLSRSWSHPQRPPGASSCA